jgi:hypothetical protein
MLILNPVFEYNDVGSKLDAESLEILEQWGKKKLVYLNQGFIELRKDGGNHIEKSICRAGSSSIVISPENELVLPCYHLGLENIPINNQLYSIWNKETVQESIKLEGKHAACEGCTINCYMQTSFATEISKYWLSALPSTLKYNLAKGTWKNLI